MTRSTSILQPGPFSTVQASMRSGYFDRGISPAGAMDQFAFRAGNLLLDNPTDEAAIEMMIMGAEVRFDLDSVISVTGAECPVTVNGQPVPTWTAISVSQGDIVRIGVCSWGCRAYLCVAGGFNVPVVLGSESTFVKGRLGGHRGRALREGDTLQIGEPHVLHSAVAGNHYEESVREKAYGDLSTIRVMWGPQDTLLTDKGRADFTAKTWKMTNDSDRTGCRFVGVDLEFAMREKSPHQGPHYWNIVDDGIPVGGIQTPGGNIAVCMGPDVVNAGGFAKPACVISADQVRLAQLTPGSEIQFVPVSDGEAVAASEQLTALLDGEQLFKGR